MALSVSEKLALWGFLDKALKALHKDLVPAAQAELVPTQREPVKFGGRLAAWVTQPKDRQGSAYIASEDKLLAWAKREHADKIEYDTSVRVDAEVIEWLQENRPDFLNVTERVDRQWAADICSGLTSQGHYITADGEKLTEVPGIEVPEPVPSSPQVRLEKDAAKVIAAAWPEIQGGLREVLTLPAAEVPPPPTDDAFFGPDGRFRSPELAALHAVTVQGGYSTPAREARRMLRDARRAGDGGYEARVAAWLDERGLSHDGDEEAPVAS